MDIEHHAENLEEAIIRIIGESRHTEIARDYCRWAYRDIARAEGIPDDAVDDAARMRLIYPADIPRVWYRAQATLGAAYDEVARGNATPAEPFSDWLYKLAAELASDDDPTSQLVRSIAEDASLRPEERSSSPYRRGLSAEAGRSDPEGGARQLRQIAERPEDGEHRAERAKTLA